MPEFLNRLRQKWPPSIPEAVSAAATVIVFVIAATGVTLFSGQGMHRAADEQHKVVRKTSHPIHIASRSVAPKPVPKRPALPRAPSAFDKEEAMTFSQRMKRWDPYISEASRRFSVPQLWIKAVMQAESGGRTMLVRDTPIVSTAGAMGLMQLMPQTYHDMRRENNLGPDPYDPHDNIMAGAAYLKFLRSKYPYPAMFAAYNDGPGNLEARLMSGGLLPMETQNYVARVTNTLAGGGVMGGRGNAAFTRPNGTVVMLNTAAIVGARTAFPGEYAPGVQSVITVGRVHQGVRESLAKVKAIVRTHGGGV